MIPLPLARIAEITSGALSGMADPRAVVRGPVVIDSRAVEPGSLFVAIKGARVDGHDYAAQAVRAGAVAVLAGRPVDAPAVIVPDAAAALAELAAAQVRTLPKVTVIGVTGSAGKTSTKDLLAKLTGRIGSTIAPVGSFNNELGHPLTVLRADLETRFMVLELAARNIGHIKDLTRIAPPQIGVVLNVGTAHLGVFGGKEAIAKAKGELVEALPRTGVAVLNADDPLVRGMASRTEARVTYFGCGEAAAIRAEGVVIDNRGRASFTLRTPSGAAHVSLKLYGAHAVSNALAAAAAGYELGLPVATIAEELSEATPRSRWRMEVTDRADGVTVVNDAYNANPDSMKAAFEAFATLGKGRRRFAVIAALRELGDEGPALNAELGRLAGGAGLAGLIVAGPDAGPVLDGAHEAAQATAQEPAAHTTFSQGAPGPIGAGPTGAGPGGAVPGVVAPAWPSVPGAGISGPQTPAGPAQTPPGPLSGPHGPAPQDRQPTGPEQGPAQSWYGPDAEHGAPQGWYGPDTGVPQPAPGPGWQVPDEGAVPPGPGWHGQENDGSGQEWQGPPAAGGPLIGGLPGGAPVSGPPGAPGGPQADGSPTVPGGLPVGAPPGGSPVGAPPVVPGGPVMGGLPGGPGGVPMGMAPETPGGAPGVPGGTPAGAPGGPPPGLPSGMPSGPPPGTPPGMPPGGPGGPPVGGPAAGPGGGAHYGQPTRIVHVPDAEAAAAELGSWLRPGDAVLIKGPRAMGLERTAEIILGGSPQ